MYSTSIQLQQLFSYYSPTTYRRQPREDNSCSDICCFFVQLSKEQLQATSNYNTDNYQRATNCMAPNMDHANWRTSTDTVDRVEVCMTEIIFQLCFNRNHVWATCSHIQWVWQQFRGCTAFSQEGRIKVFSTGYTQPTDIWLAIDL